MVAVEATPVAAGQAMVVAATMATEVVISPTSAMWQGGPHGSMLLQALQRVLHWTAGALLDIDDDYLL